MSMPIYAEANSSHVWILQIKILLDKDHWGISGNILTDFEPLLLYKLEWIRYPSVLDHRVVNSYFRFRYQLSTWRGRKFSRLVADADTSHWSRELHVRDECQL